VHWIDGHVTVITPTTVGTGLTAGSSKHGDFSLRQGIYWIGHQSAGVAYLRIDRCARSTVADSDISLLIHRRSAHPAMGSVRLIGALLSDGDWSGGDVTQFEPTGCCNIVGVDGEIADCSFMTVGEE